MLRTVLEGLRLTGRGLAPQHFMAAASVTVNVVLLLVITHQRGRHTRRESELEEARKGAARGARRKMDAQKAVVEEKKAEAEKKYACLYQRALDRIKHLKEMHTTEMSRLEVQHAAELDELKRAEKDAWRRLNVEQERATRDVKNAKTAEVLMRKHMEELNKQQKQSEAEAKDRKFQLRLCQRELERMRENCSAAQ